MTEIDSDFLPLRVTRVGLGGKRSFDPEGKRKLVEACHRPGVSVAGMALRAGVNANQLRRWIQQYEERREEAAAMLGIEHAPAAFVPVVEIGGIVPKAEPLATPGRLPVHYEPEPVPPPSSPLARLAAQLPNGVTVELECTGQDAALVAAMIKALGAQ
ncbi:IS66-like element accessory protein TnpA [Cupriavidus sp. CuC1]|uniref:IS66-like element accessory protein TnpA n=1 Tax=Cupriavidus sp. CuC1 TaxID=3373131 RepID=UPI0037D7D8B2